MNLGMPAKRAFDFPPSLEVTKSHMGIALRMLVSQMRGAHVFDTFGRFITAQSREYCPGLWARGGNIQSMYVLVRPIPVMQPLNHKEVLLCVKLCVGDVI
jgi:hypothetical protein